MPGLQNTAMVPSHVRMVEEGGFPNKAWFRLIQNLSKLLGASIAVATSPDQSLTHTTALTDATGLTFNVATNESWIAQFRLDVGAGLSTTGLKIAVTVPVGAVIDVAVAVTPDVVTAANVTYKRTTTGGAAVAFTAGNLTGVSDALVIVSFAINAAVDGGAAQLQFAQNTNSATALTIRQGSQMLASRIQ